MEQSSPMFNTTTSPSPKSSNLFDASHWSLRLLLGVVWVGLGMVALSMPIITTLSAALFFGWLLLIAGIAQVIVAIFTWDKTGMVGFISGMLFILFGMMLINNLIAGTVAVTSLIGIFFLMQGAVSLIAAFVGEKQLMLPLLIVGTFSLLFGVLIFSNLLVASVGLIGLLLGWMFVLDGFGMIASASFAGENPGAAQKILGIVVCVFIGYFMVVRLFGGTEQITPVPLPADTEMTETVLE